jgi:hypothetical protein
LRQGDPHFKRRAHAEGIDAGFAAGYKPNPASFQRRLQTEGSALDQGRPSGLKNPLQSENLPHNFNGIARIPEL